MRGLAVRLMALRVAAASKTPLRHLPHEQLWAQRLQTDAGLSHLLLLRLG